MSTSNPNKNLNAKKVPLIVKHLEDSFKKMIRNREEEEEKLKDGITILPSNIRQEGMFTRVVRNELKKVFPTSKKKNPIIEIIFKDNSIHYRSRHCTLDGKVQIAVLKNLTKEFINTNLLCDKVGSKDSDSTRKAIAVINRKGKYSLHLKENIIEGSRGQGYRIREKYKITFH